MSAVILVVLIAALLALRQNIILIVAVIVGYIHVVYADSEIIFLVQDIWFTVDREVLLSVPMFLLAGLLMARGSIATRLVRIMTAFTSFVPGGLGVAAILAMTAFSAISASSVVTLLAIGGIMHPALIRAGYSRSYAAGVLCAGGTLGIIIPPSLLMIVYGLMVEEVSITDLFKAGWGPGLSLSVMLVAYTMIVNRNLPTSSFNVREALEALKHGIFATMMPVILLGGIYTGWFTVTESAAISVLYAIIVEVFIHKELKPVDFIKVAFETTKLLGTLLLLLAVAGSLNTILDYQGVPQGFVKLLKQWIDSSFSMLLLMNFALILAGALMDEVSAILVFAPLLAPLGPAYGFDPVHFGIITIVNLQIGYVAPPVAVNLFVAMVAFKESFGFVARAVMPFIVLMLINLIIVAAVPELSLMFVR